MPKNQIALAFRRRVTKSVAANYLLFLPNGYQSRGSRRWPLILFLHGSGERGRNVARVAAHGPPKIVKANPDFPFLVVSPQCPSGCWWSPDLVLALLDEVTQRHAVDPARIYLTGLSMGGYGTWHLGLSYPERFAAIAPVCGGGDPLAIVLANRNRLRLLKQLPVWAFHGAKDPLVPLHESERMVRALQQIGNQPKFTVYPDAGHDCWTETYDRAELYDWFLQHRRRSRH